MTGDDIAAMANDTEYGLVAYLYSNDNRRIQTLTRALEYGMVAVNTPKITGAPIPFGGVKQSGLGRGGLPPRPRGIYRIEICLHQL